MEGTREKLIAIIEQARREAVGTVGSMNSGFAVWYADKLLAADVAPVVHGEWISDGDGYNWCYTCSVCGWVDGYPFNDRHKFCPHCGAKMDGEDEG